MYLNTFFFFNGGWGPWRCKCLGPTKVLIWSWLAQGHTAGKGQKNVRQALVSLTSRLIRCIWRAETVPSFLSWYLIPGDSSVNVELNYIVTPNCFIQWTMNSKLLQIFFFFFFFWPCWVFVAVPWLSVVAGSWNYSRCSAQASHWGGIPCGAQALGCMDFSSCGTWAQWLWLMGSAAQAQ